MELIEQSAVADGVRSGGDTVWCRRLAFEPIRLTRGVWRDELDINRVVGRRLVPRS